MYDDTAAGDSVAVFVFGCIEEVGWIAENPRYEMATV